MNADIIADIVTFWLRDSRDSPDRAWFHRGWWYEGSPAVDEEIRAGSRSRRASRLSFGAVRYMRSWLPARP